MNSRNRQRLLVPAGLLACAALLYGNSLAVPWYYDDFHNIVTNPRVADLGRAFAESFTPRGLSFLSFALNIALGGPGVLGFHLVNILIHAGNAFLVYLLLRQLYPDSLRWPLAGSLLFLAHPVQTQAVTYVVQRMTSLSCLFLLAALLLFLGARRRLGEGAAFASARHLFPYGLGLACAILAVFSKENTVILPVLLLTADCFVPAGPKSPLGRRLAYVAPFLLAPALAVLAQVTGDGSTLQALNSRSIEFFLPPTVPGGHSIPTLTPENLRWRYLATEFTVFWVYLKLLVAPVGLVLDYSYPLAERFFNPRSLIALGGLAALVALAFAARRRSPWTWFGVLWFFIALSVESTFFPLDPIFEHRLYLPMVGVAMLFIEFFRRLPDRLALPLVAVVLLACSLLTVQRNDLWARPVAFWEDNVARVGHSYRPKDNLAVEYYKAGRYDEALELWQEALSIEPRGYSMHENLAQLYLDRGMLEEAKRHLQTAIVFNPKPARLYSKLGSVYATGGDPASAVGYMEKAAGLDPEDGQLEYNLGSVYYKLGRLAEAEAAYRRSVRLAPDYPKARFALGFILYETDRLEGAFAELAQAREREADDANLLLYYALAAFRTGRSAQGNEAMALLEKLDEKAYRKLSAKLAALQAAGS